MGMVLGQVRTADKSSGITALPELLSTMRLKGGQAPSLVSFQLMIDVEMRMP